ncbi:MAG TPA: DUF6518 family protein [Streptosporangiaceae bacterium]|jgi:hypothetical protein
MIRRLALISALAFAFGFTVASLKGQGGGLLDGVGNLSAPWLLVAFLPGLQSRSVVKGAMIGLAATMLALAGFYLAVTLGAHYYGLHGLRAGLGLAVSANRRYFEAGLLSGPVCGAFGSWWSSRGSYRAVPVAGALLLAEPAVILAISAVHALSRYAGGWSADPGIYVAEFLAGAVVLIAARLLPRRGSAA